MAGSDVSEPLAEIADDDPLQLMYTSGTEARPKGVTLTSRSLIAQYVTAIVDGGMSEADVEAHALPFYHCAQLHCFFTPDVYLGATSIILGGAEPATLLQTIETERITKLFCPPTVWISLLRHPSSTGGIYPRCRRATTAHRRCPSRCSRRSRRAFPS